jgi:hypothetical protein
MVTAVPVVTCASHVEGAGRSVPAAVAKRMIEIPDVLRLTTPKRAYIPGLGVRTERGFVYKIPAGVNAGNPGRTVRLTVAEPGAQLEYGGQAGRSLRLRACPPAHKRFFDGLPIGPWTGWAGGIVVREATCVHLVVRTGSRSYRLALGLGVRCP